MGKVKESYAFRFHLLHFVYGLGAVDDKLLNGKTLRVASVEVK